MASVQFRSADAVLTAYENRNCAPWALFQGRQFLFKYEGNNVEEGKAALTEWLDLLSEGTNAIYTIKVYDSVPGKIKENTPCDGSFNFRLNDESQVITNSQYTRVNQSREISEALAKLNARLDAIEGDDDDEEEDETLGALGDIDRIMSHPAVVKLVGMISGKPVEQLPAAAISGVPGDQEVKISEALTILKLHDARLGDHLGKLAQIAQTKKENFEYLLKVLDSM